MARGGAVTLRGELLPLGAGAGGAAGDTPTSSLKSSDDKRAHQRDNSRIGEQRRRRWWAAAAMTPTARARVYVQDPLLCSIRLSAGGSQPIISSASWRLLPPLLPAAEIQVPPQVRGGVAHRVYIARGHCHTTLSLARSLARSLRCSSVRVRAALSLSTGAPARLKSTGGLRSASRLRRRSLPAQRGPPASRAPSAPP